MAQWHESPMIMGLNGTHVACASKARWEGGTRSCLDEGDKLRSSLCLPRSSEIPNPGHTACSDGCGHIAQDHKWCWLLLLHDEDRLSRLSVFSKDILKKTFLIHMICRG